MFSTKPASQQSQGFQSKRPATDGHNVSENSLPGRLHTLEQSNPTIGTGDYANPLTLYTAKQLLTVERRVASLEGALYKHYELTDPTTIISPCKDVGTLYSETCRAQKGKKIGPYTNYCVLGLMNGLLVAPKSDPADVETLKKWMMEICACVLNSEW